MAPAGGRPFDGLDPSAVLRTLDALGFEGDGRLLQLNSYENRVFQVHLIDGRVVVAKFYRPHRWRDEQILEEHALALALHAADVPLVPPVVLPAAAGNPSDPTVHVHELGEPATLARVQLDREHEHRVAVALRRAGRSANLEDLDVLRWLGRYVARLHNVGAQAPFKHRRVLQIQAEMQQARDVIAAWPAQDEAARDRWVATCDRVRALVLAAVGDDTQVHAQFGAMRVHGDMHPGNILWRDEGEDRGPHLVDLDDACMAPAVQDLWMLLSGEPGAAALQKAALLEGYRLFRDFDESAWRLVEPLRTLRMVRHNAWIAERWHDPAFPAAFPWFDSPGFWAQQATMLQEQADRLDQPD